MTDQQLAEFREWLKKRQERHINDAVIENARSRKFMSTQMYYRYDAAANAYGAVLHKLEEMMKEPACVECREKEGK